MTSMASRERPRRPRGIRRLRQVTHDDKVTGARPGEERDLLRGHAAGDEDRHGRPSPAPAPAPVPGSAPARRLRGLGEVLEAGTRSARFGGGRFDRSGRDIREIARAFEGAGQVGRTMGGEPDDGVRSEDAPGQGDRGVVLADMDSVRPGFERKVGAVVEDERHAGVRADGADQCGPLQKGSGVEVFVPQLHDVHPAGDAGRDKSGEVGPVGCAEVEAALRDGRHGRAREGVTRWTSPWPSPSRPACRRAPWPGSRGR